MRPSRPARRRTGDAVVTPVLPPGQDVDLGERGIVPVRLWPGPDDRRSARRLAPLVLLHGWTVTADLNWFRLYEPLGRRHSFAAFDQRGHGRGLRPESFTLEDCADDVIALADALGWEQVVPVGYSMGGTIAQLVAHRHPDRVAGLVLCSTAAVFSETRQDMFFFEGLLGTTVRALKAAPPFLRQRVPGRLRSPDPTSPLADWMYDETRRHDAALIAEAGRAVGRFRSEEWLHTIDVPTAVVVTTEDTVVAPTRQRQLAAGIPGATLHTVALDHRAAVTQPGQYLPMLDEALASVARRQKGKVRAAIRQRRPAQPARRALPARGPQEPMPEPDVPASVAPAGPGTARARRAERRAGGVVPGETATAPSPTPRRPAQSAPAAHPAPADEVRGPRAVERRSRSTGRRADDHQPGPQVRRVLVSGRVQGVGFRQSMQRRAEELGLSGWVRNRRDGRVEAVVAGARERVEELVSWARHGPPMAEVDDVRSLAEREADHPAIIDSDGFEVRASE